MKYCICICLFSIIFLTDKSIAQRSEIYATVDENNVTLWNTSVERNCGAIYSMAVELNDHFLKWTQVDSGNVFFCLCIFDLSVTYGPLEPGDYTTDVYFTNADETEEYYEGSASFTISSGIKAFDGGILAEYQSECLNGLDINEKGKQADIFRIYPNPIQDGEVLQLDARITGREADLEIVNPYGEVIFSTHYNCDNQIGDQWHKTDLFPVSGFYLIRLKTSDQVYVKKISVL